MPPRPSDRALRKLVADLADRSKADVRAVLGDLGPGERLRIEKLIAEYRGEATGARPANNPTPATDTAGLSPWLTARVRTAAEGAPPTDFVITRQGLDALREAAASVGIDRRPAAAPVAAGIGSVFFDMMSRWLSGPGR